MEMIYADTPAGLDMPLGDAMFSQRAIRRFRHDKPIGDEDLRAILEAAAKAPNGGNMQPGRFLVLRDPERIKQFGALYYEAWWAKRNDDYGWKDREDMPVDSSYRFPALLADEMVDAPAIVLAFSDGGLEASVLPGVQNLMLAARAIGIGSVLTTLHPKVMDRVFKLLLVPSGMLFHCCVPLGYPRGNFGPTRRFPTAATTYWDSWEIPPPWA